MLFLFYMHFRKLLEYDVDMFGIFWWFRMYLRKIVQCVLVIYLYANHELCFNGHSL